MMLRTAVLVGLVAFAPQASFAGEVVGRVIDSEGAGVAVGVVLEINDGQQIVYTREATTGADGVARWNDVPDAPELQARLVANFDGAEYVSAPLALDNGSGAIELTVYPVLREGRPLHLDTFHLIAQIDEPSVLRVLQFMTISNAGVAAYAGGPALSDGRQAGIVIPLPSAATNVRPAPFPSPAAALSMEDAQFDSDRILDPRPVPPDGRQVAVTYDLPVDAEIDVQLQLPYPTQSVTLLLGGAARDTIELSSDQLESEGQQSIGDQQYDLWSVAALQPGTSVQFSVGPPGLAVSPGQWSLIAMGAGLLIASIASLLGGASEQFAQRQRADIIARIAQLDDSHVAGDLSDGDYFARRGRELEKLDLLELGRRVNARGA
jgi:hypothetical protein